MMAAMKRKFVQVVNFFIHLFRPYRTEWVEDLPEEPRKKFIYIVGGREYPFEAKFLCPLGCGDILSVDIAPEHKKRWNVTEHQNGAISLTPSVWLRTECRCHFWMREGHIVWCEVPPFRIAWKRKWNRNKSKKLS